MTTSVLPAETPETLISFPSAETAATAAFRAAPAEGTTANPKPAAQTPAASQMHFMPLIPSPFTRGCSKHAFTPMAGVSQVLPPNPWMGIARPAGDGPWERGP